MIKLNRCSDFWIVNRYYSWKLQSLHVNASNLYKITITHVLDRNISLPREQTSFSFTFWRFSTDDKTSSKFFFILSFTPYIVSIRGVTTVMWSFKEPWITESFNANMCHDSCTTANLLSKCKARRNTILRYTCVKKLLKMACCWKNIVACMHPM